MSVGKLEPLRPSMPKKLIERIAPSCYSYRNNLHRPVQKIAARLRDSEDYLMLFRVFNESAYVNQDQGGSTDKHPYRQRS